MNRPKVLVLTGALPYPLTTGAKIRTFNLLKTLVGQFHIELLTVVTNTSEKEHLQALERSGITCHYIFAENLDGRTAKLTDAVLSFLLSDPYLIRHYTIPAYRRRIDDLLANTGHDIIHCDSISMTGNLRGLDKNRLILTQHNIEQHIWAGYADHADGIIRRFYRNQHRKVRRLESRLESIYGHIITVSENDKRFLEKYYPAANITVVENGVDLDKYRNSVDPENRHGIIFTGSLDWHPNIDGLHWFIRHVYPRLHESLPDVSISIVGRKPARSLRDAMSGLPGLELHADVPQIQSFLRGARVMIVPLRIGGGSRLKILEAMASEVPVVSTVKGAEGLAIEDGKNIIIRDNPEEFAQALVEILQDTERHWQLAAAGLDLVKNRYAWEITARPLADLWKQVAHA